MTTIRTKSQSAASTGTRLLPVVPPRGVVPPDIDEWLSWAARAAPTGDSETRNLLFDAYWPRLRRICYRVWSQFCQGTIVARQDVEQEAFLVFAALLARWPGNGSFSSYLLGSFPWRLRDAVMQLKGPQETSLIDFSLAELATISYDVEQAVHLLEDLARQFAPIDRQILLMRIRDGAGVRQIAAALKVNRRTVQRRMALMRTQLWKDLNARTAGDD